MKIGILYSRLRVEEKLLFAALEARGLDYDRIDDRQAVLDAAAPDEWLQYDVILERCLSTSRGLYALQILNAWGVPTVNTAQVAAACADKVATTAALVAAGVPQPRVKIAFTPQSALAAIEEMGYPVIMKPVVGSWGRLLARINDRDAAEALLEHKDTLGSYQHSIFYIQEHIQKPGRDIRAIVIGEETVCAIYRHSSHWITNTARNGRGEVCPVTPELDALCLAAAHAVGGGVLSIDLLEDPERGLLVNEINHTMEFHTAAPTSGVDIAGLVIDYLISVGQRELALPMPAFPVRAEGIFVTNSPAMTTQARAS